MGVRVSLEAGTADGGHATGDALIAVEGLRGSAFGDVLTGTGGVNCRRLGEEIGSQGSGARIGSGAARATTCSGSRPPGAARVEDFDDVGDDRWRLTGFGAAFDTAAEVLAAAVGVGEDVRLTLAASVIWLEDTRLNTLAADDFVFAASTGARRPLLPGRAGQAERRSGGRRLGDRDGDRLGHRHLHARSRTDRLGEAAHFRPHHGALGKAVGRAEGGEPAVAVIREEGDDHGGGRRHEAARQLAFRSPRAATVVTGSPVSDGSAMATVRDW